MINNASVEVLSTSSKVKLKLELHLFNRCNNLYFHEPMTKKINSKNKFLL